MGSIMSMQEVRERAESKYSSAMESLVTAAMEEDSPACDVYGFTPSGEDPMPGPYVASFARTEDAEEYIGFLLRGGNGSYKEYIIYDGNEDACVKYSVNQDGKVASEPVWF